MIQFNVIMITLYIAVDSLGVGIRISSITSVADTFVLFLSIVIFLYAIMKMRQNLKKLETTTVNEQFIMVHLVNFGVYTILWAIFQVMYHLSK